MITERVGELFGEGEKKEKKIIIEPQSPIIRFMGWILPFDNTIYRLIIV